VPPAAAYTTQHTVFEADYATEHGLQLQRPACADHRSMLTDQAVARTFIAWFKQELDLQGLERRLEGLPLRGVTGLLALCATDPDAARCKE